MAMKILLMAMLVAALGHGAAQNCRSRSVLAEIHTMRVKTHCTKPQESLVQLPVPDGYDYVRPSAAKLKQCTGLACQVYPEKCLPDPNNITTKKFRVFAFSAKDHSPNCVEVEVKEHGACECRCHETDCPPNKVLKEETCECKCDPRKKDECTGRRHGGLQVQWSEKTCSCKCVHDVPCDSHMTWVQELCKCVNSFEEEPYDQNYQDYFENQHEESHEE